MWGMIGRKNLSKKGLLAGLFPRKVALLSDYLPPQIIEGVL
jgi:hypothetical protein